MPVGDLSTSVVARFERAIAYARSLPDQAIGLSVSGGGDSIALMHLAARIRDPKQLHILTVDHGLRPEAKEEVALVASQAAMLGIEYDVTQWVWDGNGNLQAAARAGRWDALRDWARKQNLDEIWVGHTEDDQLETALMRLARGSGIDGLSAMYPLTRRDGARVLRPLLGVSRDELRAWLTSEKIAWCDDPSNQDPRFDRVRARQMFAQLEALGLTRKRLLQTIDHMQAAVVSLQAAAAAFARLHVRQDTGDLLFFPQALDLETADVPRRVMAAGLGWVASRSYRPRFEQMLETVAQARAGATVTLGGCILMPEGGGTVRLTREAAGTTAISPQMPTDRDVLWDQRWELKGRQTGGLTFKALGEGIKDCPDWRDSGMPRASLLASPSVWEKETLLAAPVAGLRNGWSARIVTDFHTSAFAIED